ncbi:GMC family oxidoreductase [Comamonas odontotermitis]|uniref:GMC family oxidoreductase n=1 Tax=Comamonas odontotermitis TaxID=379895 RepID=UPI00366F590C
MEQFDYIIVGAGSAGCALANRLTASGRHRVLLLEGGGPDSNVWIHVPLGVGKLLTNDKYAWRFETEPQDTLKGQRIYWPRGKVLGGSSALNGMAYVWGDPSEYDSWQQQGIQGWNFRDILPYFKRLESNMFSDNPLRGRDGPVRITDRGAYDTDKISDAYVAACREAGIQDTQDYNAGSYEGVRYLEQTAWRGRRWSAAVAYLNPAKNRANLVVRTEALVHRVIVEGSRCTGVEYEWKGQRHTAGSKREVVLSAGAIQSPQLLELSGIGDVERLRSAGIHPLHDLPAVGEHVSDHLQVRCAYRSYIPGTINDLMRSPLYKMKAGLQYMLSRRGLLASTSSTAHAITRAQPNAERPDVMIRIYHISGKDRYSRSPGAGIDPWSGFSIGGFMLYPKSRGNIHIASADPKAFPSIQPNYLADEEDRETTVNMLHLIRRIAAQPALGGVIQAEQRPGPSVEQHDALLDYARETGQTAWHTVGSCRMGASAQDSVVDSQLRVHGIHGLRVADASIMPTIASSNTNAPAMMIGERAADLILADAAMH